MSFTIAELEAKATVLEEQGASIELRDEILLCIAHEFTRLADIIERFEKLAKENK